MPLFKEVQPCGVQICPGYVELPDATSACASTITSPTYKSDAPESSHICHTVEYEERVSSGASW